MSYRIAVLVKQVPDTDEVKMDETTGTMVREGVDSVINPLDLNALEAALDLKRRFGGDISAVTMGPPQAEDALREALSLGADRALFVTDRAFAGADTWATALVLAEALKLTGPYDLILSGAKATDGETGQVGPELASLLDMPCSTYVTGMDVSERTVNIRRVVEDGYESQSFAMPGLVTVLHGINEPSMPTLSGKIKARKSEITIIDREKLGLNGDNVGLKGSCTRVVSIARPKLSRNTEFFSGRNIAKGVDRLVEKLCEMSLIQCISSSRVVVDDGDGTHKAAVKSNLVKGEDIVCGAAHDDNPCNGVMVLGEVRNGRVTPVTLELSGHARSLADARGSNVRVILLTDRIDDDLSALVGVGADEVLIARHSSFGLFNQEICAKAVAVISETLNPEILITGATTSGRTVFPAAAALMKTGLTADCTGLDIDIESGLLIQTRPAIGGNAIASIKTPERRPQMATVRPRNFRIPPLDSGRCGRLRDVRLPESVFVTRLTSLGVESSEGDNVRIQDKDVVVSGGRGLKRGENFRMIEELASLLDAGVGASRPTIEAKWIEYPHQVGLSGKVVTPKAYIAVGISGAVQHLAGMQNAGFIAAINRDAEANIFRVADLGLCGDMFQIIPMISEKIRKLRG